MIKINATPNPKDYIMTKATTDQKAEPVAITKGRKPGSKTFVSGKDRYLFIKKLVRLTDAGKTAAEISAETNVPETYIRNACKTWGMPIDAKVTSPGKALSLAKRAAIVAMIEAGLSDDVIAVTGVSASTLAVIRAEVAAN